MIRRTSLFFAMVAAVAGVYACDSLSDPTKGGAPEPATTGRVSGALVGAVPANSHVALVWQTSQSTFAIGADAPVLDGRFTMDIGAVADGNFVVDGSEVTVGIDASASDPYASGGDASAGDPDPIPSFDAGIGTKSVRIRTTVSGGTVTEPLERAIGGFVVYVDTNGNGTLDFDPRTGAVTDKLLGGNPDLRLTAFRKGGVLDLERLRDRTGHVPEKGLNIYWTSESLWLGLDKVELKLGASARLPYELCYGAYVAGLCGALYGGDGDGGPIEEGYDAGPIYPIGEGGSYEPYPSYDAGTADGG